jgi:hypothetical protein
MSSGGSSPKVLDQINYLIQIVSNKENEIARLKNESAKKDKNMQFMIDLLQKQASNSVTLENVAKK